MIIVKIVHLNGEYRLPWDRYRKHTVQQIVDLARKYYPEDEVTREKKAQIGGKDLDPKMLIDAIPDSKPGMKIQLVLAARGTIRVRETEDEDEEPFSAELRKMMKPIPTTLPEIFKEWCPVVDDDADLECCVCLDPTCIEDFRKVRKCAHTFHSACLIRWLTEQRTKIRTCPMCRASVNQSP